MSPRPGLHTPARFVRTWPKPHTGQHCDQPHRSPAPCPLQADPLASAENRLLQAGPLPLRLLHLQVTSNCSHWPSPPSLFVLRGRCAAKLELWPPGGPVSRGPPGASGDPVSRLRKAGNGRRVQKGPHGAQPTPLCACRREGLTSVASLGLNLV